MTILSHTFTLKSKAFSVNRMTYKNKNHTTAEYQTWARNILFLLNEESIVTKLTELRELFNPEIHRYIFEMITFFPHHILFTQQSKMSSKAFDVSNIEKPLVDLIYLPKYFDKPAPYGAQNLNIDDKFISDLSSKKRAADEHALEITISIESLSDILPSVESDQE